MASDPSRTPPTSTLKSRRPLVVGIVVALVVVIAIVVVAVVAGLGSPASTASAPDANSQGTDAGGTPLPVDGAGAPSVAGPTADPAAPVEQSPVPFDSPAPVADGVEVSLSGLTSVDGVANGVGEVGGPSIQFTVSVTNSGTDPVSLQSAVVGVTYGQNQTPSNVLESAGTPLPVEVAAGQTVTGTYVFVVPTDARSDVRITLDYLAGTPVAVFEGAAPN